MSLTDLINKELPLNRKERFYTGTVFPAIVCHNNFQFFRRFLEAIGCNDLPGINPIPGTANIQFFTEYSLNESIKGSTDALQRFVEHPHTKETPDIIILVKGEKVKSLIALEAKMYDRPNVYELREQMDAQREKVLTYLEKQLNLTSIHHFALLPESYYLEIKAKGFNYPTLTWEKIYEIYKPVLRDHYFLEVLKLALDLYDNLSSKGGFSGSYNEGKMLGKDIYSQFKNRDLRMISVGRKGGINGQFLTDDITSGQWKVQIYEVSSQDNSNRMNWFSAEDFIKKIDSPDPSAMTYDGSSGASYATANSKSKMRGSDIYKQFMAGNFRIKTVGRGGGLYGNLFQTDLETGEWKNFSYEVSPQVDPMNRNWFTIGDFIELINQTKPGDSTTMVARESSPSSVTRRIIKTKMKGKKIYELYKRGSLNMQIAGRFGGLYGSLCQGDLNSGSWQDFDYEVSDAAAPLNRNWFLISDFIFEIDKE
jgi:hypothetical protein